MVESHSVNGPLEEHTHSLWIDMDERGSHNFVFLLPPCQIVGGEERGRRREIRYFSNVQYALSLKKFFLLPYFKSCVFLSDVVAVPFSIAIQTYYIHRAPFK